MASGNPFQRFSRGGRCSLSSRFQIIDVDQTGGERKKKRGGGRLLLL